MYKTRGVWFASGVIGLALLSLVIQPTKTRMERVVSASPQHAASLAPFTAVELNGGVKAVLQYGSPQRVTILKGSEDVSLMTVTDEKLVINKCRDKCPRGYELHVEIVTPLITALAATNGGTIESRGDFPHQTVMSLAVRNGGTVDARAITANNITSAVSQGGRILAYPQMTLLASVSNGGVITYWGNAHVTASTDHGGAVNKGAATDLEKPLSEVESPVSCPDTPKAPAPPKRSRTIVI